MYVALLAEGVDRNDEFEPVRVTAQRSPSSRRAWIEIVKRKFNELGSAVALLAEGVDRNVLDNRTVQLDQRVALLAEGVDRNCSCVRLGSSSIASPSSRRAWIEIGKRRNLQR